MALSASNPYSQGIYEAVKGAQGLMDDYNKVNISKDGGGTGDTDTYEVSLTEEEIISLTKSWKAQYQTYYDNTVSKSQKVAFDYWIGNQKVDVTETLDGHDTIDNETFDNIETLIPMITRANPDPLVTGDSSPNGLKLSYNIKNALVFEADRQHLKPKMKRLTRQWMLFLIGGVKIAYDRNEDNIVTTVRQSKNFIFDKDGTIDEAGFFDGEYLGEKMKQPAEKLIEMFPKKKEEILRHSKGKLSMMMEYIEWWYQNKDVFYTLNDTVLGKFKNPHWNYDMGEVKGKNHFRSMKAPYIFLSVFSIGARPHDDTSLIIQNVGIQDIINKRYRQIDKNADSQNNGALASGEAFTKEQASEASHFLRKGGTVWVPSGDVEKAWKRDAAPSLTPDVYDNLKDSREQLRNRFGTSGSTPQGLENQDTVRGKILISQADSSRSGAITEALENACASIYNYWIQMIYVHWDNPHYISAMGLSGAQETISIRNTDITQDVFVSVKEGTLIPKDPLTERNEAMDLWGAQAIGLVQLYQRLDFPDPQESAKQTLIWQMVAHGQLPPQILFPDFPGQQAQATPPGAPTQQQGVVNPPNQTPPMSPGAVQQESQQLLASTPIKQV